MESCCPWAGKCTEGAVQVWCITRCCARPCLKTRLLWPLEHRPLWQGRSGVTPYFAVRLFCNGQFCVFKDGLVAVFLGR